ncbi:MAG: TonB-dependent receptor [Rhodobacteraceae bacterium]|nr:TonB-dependent receptor [Paracoccaceae bacterium]
MNTGIVRYFYTGGQPLLVLIDGRPYASSASDLDTLPISAIERIELLSGDSLGTLGGGAIRGAINIVLRKDLNGFETRGLTRLPDSKGGDGLQGSIFWGGEVGEGRMVIGVDILNRQEIPSRYREHSRSAWKEDGTFNQAQNISEGGNTVWVINVDSGGNVENVRSVSLGDCDPGNGYTGPLSNPTLIRNGDKGCGFAYGKIAWNTDRLQQRSVILNLDHPLGEGAELHLDANFGQGNSAFRFAPPVGVFPFTPNVALINAINAAGLQNNPTDPIGADSGDFFVVGHRFVGHGNRDWKSKWNVSDIALSIEGKLAEGLGYDARIESYRFNGSLSGDTFVHEGKIGAEIAAGNYDLANPFSTDQDHLDAIERSSLREEIDSGGEYQGTRLALEGNTFAVGGRNAAWTAGFAAGKSKARFIQRFRDNDGMTHDVTQVLGSGGVSFAGERKAVGLFAEMALPLTETLDFRVAGRADDTDDVGRLESWNLAAEYRPHDIVALRSSLSAGQSVPSMIHLYGTESQDHPYVECIPDLNVDPPRPCVGLHPRQVTREITSNPKLGPSDTRRFAISAEARTSRNTLSVEWYRLSRANLVELNDADWVLRNFEKCEEDETSGCIEQTGGDITIYDSYANVGETKITGVTTRFGSRGFESPLGEFGITGAWRHVIDAKRSTNRNERLYAFSKNMARLRFHLQRGSLSTIWTTNYRAGFNTESGNFKSWTGHDLVLDWKEPLGIKDMRAAAGVFNLTDAGLTINTADPNSVDGPSVAGWGRTFFLTVNMRF